MKVIFSFILVFVGINLYSQGNVCVYINYNENQCGNSTACSFGWVANQNTSAYKLTSKAKERANDRCYSTDYRSYYRRADDVKNMLIIRWDKTYKGCVRTAFGVGFGDSESEAKEGAIKDMIYRNSGFSRSTSYKVVEKQSF